MGTRQRIRITPDATGQTHTTPPHQTKPDNPRRPERPPAVRTVLKDPATWICWVAFLCALFALNMTRDQWHCIDSVRVATNHRLALRAKRGWCVVGARASHSSSP